MNTKAPSYKRWAYTKSTKGFRTLWFTNKSFEQEIYPIKISIPRCITEVHICILIVKNFPYAYVMHRLLSSASQTTVIVWHSKEVSMSKPTLSDANAFQIYRMQNQTIPILWLKSFQKKAACQCLHTFDCLIQRFTESANDSW